MAVVATVLAIACVNLAGLLMARGIGRRGEFALRAALGAGRWRLMRQLAIESFVLAACGGAAGLAIAYWATQILIAMSGGALTAGIAGPIGLDLTSLLFTFAISAVTTMVFGLAPARQASRVDPQVALRERTRGAGATGDRRHHRLRGALVVIEVALAMVLLIGAGLLLRSLSSLMRVELGFQPARTITMGLFLGIRPPETRVAMLGQIVDRVQNLPGVKAAGTIQFLPLRGMTCAHRLLARGRCRGTRSVAHAVDRVRARQRRVFRGDGNSAARRPRVRRSRSRRQSARRGREPRVRITLLCRRQRRRTPRRRADARSGRGGDRWRRGRRASSGIDVGAEAGGVLAACAGAGLHHEPGGADGWRSVCARRRDPARDSRGRSHASRLRRRQPRTGCRQRCSRGRGCRRCS